MCVYGFNEAIKLTTIEEKMISIRIVDTMCDRREARRCKSVVIIVVYNWCRRPPEAWHC